MVELLSGKQGNYAINKTFLKETVGKKLPSKGNKLFITGADTLGEF